jgi:NADH:ubiquinone oxidoreductase subunit H
MYFTLFERKIIAAMQRRVGPDYVGFWGVLQPLADGIKLLLKEFVFPKNSEKYYFILTPFFIFFFSILTLSFVPIGSLTAIYNSEFSIL